MSLLESAKVGKPLPMPDCQVPVVGNVVCVWCNRPSIRMHRPPGQPRALVMQVLSLLESAKAGKPLPMPGQAGQGSAQSPSSPHALFQSAVVRLPLVHNSAFMSCSRHKSWWDCNPVKPAHRVCACKQPQLGLLSALNTLYLSDYTHCCSQLW